MALFAQGREILMNELESLRDEVRAFAAAREWDKFHSPKNLAMALSVEAAELLEVFQWSTEEQSRAPTPETRAAAAEEIADVLIYLLQLAHKLGIDPAVAVREKLVANARKYPVEKSRGLAKKYTEL
jgi:dCTP diphosphatase